MNKLFNKLVNFLTEKVLLFWPDGWMSLNLLYNRYILTRNQQQQLTSTLNRSTESTTSGSLGINNQNSPSNTSGKSNANVIHISSKNGKTIRIEAQSVNQVQAGIFFNQSKLDAF